MFSSRRRAQAIVVLVLLVLLVVEPLPALPSAGRRGSAPNIMRPLRSVASAFASVPDAFGAAAGAVGDFFGGLFGGSRAQAAKPVPSPSPSPTQPPEPVEELVELRTRDSKTFRNADGSYSAQFGRYVHYKDANGAWQDVDLNFRKAGKDNVMDRHDLKVKVAGSLIEVTERATGKGIRFPLPAQASVSGKKANFTGADGKTWSYTNTTAGIKLEVTMTSRMGPKTYAFPYELLGGATPLVIDSQGAVTSDVFLIPPPLAYGADGEIYPMGSWRMESGSVAFDFDDSALPEEALPYVLDPEAWFIVAAGADDGVTAKKATTYPPGGAVQFEATSGGILAARKKVGGALPYMIFNALMRWNTSSLPDDAFFYQGMLLLYVDYVDDVNNRAMTADWYSNWPIDAGDYSQDALSTANWFGSLGWDLSSIAVSPAGAENILALVNLDNVSRTGYTGLRLHINGGQPTGSNQVRAFSIEGTGTQPRLWMNYAQVLQDSPADGAILPSVTPVVKASTTENIGAQHEFQVATASNFATGSIVGASGWLPSTANFTVPPGWLKDGQTYYWRVRGRYGASIAAWTTQPVRSFTVKTPKLGVRDYWPMWSAGPLAVNQANGNLVLSVPGPSYPTAVSSLSAAATYNQHATADQGLGGGWTLAAGDALGSPPSKLVDHNQLTGDEKYDAVEMVFPDGGADYYTHVGASNTYISAPGDGSLLWKNIDNTWTLIDVDGSFYTFGAPLAGTYTLTAAEVIDSSPGEGKLTYAFNTSQTPARITSITDTAGRSLAFTWNVLNPSGCAAAILCMTGPDGVTWRYVGDAGGGVSGRLARVNNGTRDVLAIIYDASGRPQKIQNANDLNPAGASPGYDPTHGVTIAYDTASPARVLTVTDGPFTGQTPASSTWSFEYVPVQISTGDPGGPSAPSKSHEGIAAGAGIEEHGPSLWASVR